MWSQRITWTALPWGHDDHGRPRLSAFASLRLDPGAQPATLSSFPDVAAWSDLVARTTFTAIVEAGVEAEGVPERELATEVLSAAPDAAVFGTVLPGSSPVAAFAFADQTSRPIISYSIGDVLTGIEELYGSVGAQDPERLPNATWSGGPDGASTPMDRLLGEVGGLLGVAPAPRQIELPEEQLRGSTRRSSLPGPHELTRGQLDEHGRVYGTQPAAVNDPEAAGLAGRALELARAWRFHHRPETRLEDKGLATPDPDWVRPPIAQPEIDVHGALTLLADHPLLLRTLGLVVDLAVLGDVPQGRFRMRLVASYADPQPDSRTTHHAPWSRVVHDAARFIAADGGDVVAGQLDLSGAQSPGSSTGPFDIVQVDPDGAALRVVNAASTMRALAVGLQTGFASYDTPREGSLPTLRSAGLAIVRGGRKDALLDRLAASKALDAAATADLAAPAGTPPKTEFDAGHLVRGLRIDIARRRRRTRLWSPWLSLHRRTTTWRVGEQVLGGDSATGPPEYSGEGALRITSATSVDESDAMYLHESVARWAGWSLSVPRPSRITRAQDLPGGRQLEVVELPGDPAPHPDFPFVATSHLIDGEGTLPALRFGDHYRFRARAVDLAGNALTPDGAGDDLASPQIQLLRWEPVAPPDLVARKPFREGSSLWRMVIRSDAGVTAAAYKATGRDESLDDRYALAPPTSVATAEAHGRFDKPDGTPDPAAYAVAKREAAVLRGEPPWSQVAGNVAGPPVTDLLPDGSEQQRANPGSYWIYTGDDLGVPYLPDPMAAGWAVRDARDLTLLATLPWNGEWPDPQPIRIELVELAEGQPRRVAPDDVRPNVLVVSLAPGERTELLLSSALVDHEVDLLGPLSWARDRGDADSLRRLALEGRHWQCTPPRKLALVHAVQRPLWVPQILPDTHPSDDAPDGLRAERWPDATDARLRGTLKLHVKSTGQLTIDAAWSECLDSIDNPKPNIVASQGRIVSVPVPAWLESQEDGRVRFPFLERPLMPGEDRLPEGEPVLHEFGDTKHRLVKYTLTATTRFREYFPLTGNQPVDGATPLEEAKLAQTPVTARVHVRSSARPVAPRVRHALPAVRWERTRSEHDGRERVRSVRHGGGIRVWLERPWYSSGDDELLGAVLDRDDRGVAPELQPFVSQYGRDPIWATAQPRKGPFIADFEHHDATAEALILEEPAPGPNFDVVAYKPVFDPVHDGGRGLWSADLWLPRRAASSYMPFVRLALARYQPWSVFGCELSRVTQLDFLQLLPSRILTVDWRDEQSFDVTLSGVAPDGPIEHRVELSLEAHDGSTPGDLGWRPIADHEAVPMDEGVPEDDPILDLLDERLRVELPRTSRLRLREGERSARSQVLRGSLRGAPSIADAGLAELSPQLDFDVSKIPAWVLPGQHVWSARVRLPERRGLRPQRLMVREYERITSDHEAVNGNIERAAIGERIVYLETVGLGEVAVT